MRKLTIAIPRAIVDLPHCRDSVSVAFKQLESKGLDCGYIATNNMLIPGARNELVRIFQREPAEYMCFVDSDMFLHRDTFTTLLERMERNKHIGILGGLYFRRDESQPVPDLGYRKDVQEERYPGQEMSIEIPTQRIFNFLTKNPQILNDRANGYAVPKISDNESLLEVDATGTGLMMIRREVYDKMEPPWFTFDDWGHNEDFNFCLKAKDLGSQVFVDLSVMAGHKINYFITHKDFLAMVNQMPKKNQLEIPKITMY